MKSMLQIAAVLAFVLVLAGCTGYHKKPGIFGGYTDHKLDNESYSILFTSKEQSEVVDFARLRACELSTENGYAFFRILNETEGFGGGGWSFCKLLIKCLHDKPQVGTVVEAAPEAVAIRERRGIQK